MSACRASAMVMGRLLWPSKGPEVQSLILHRYLKMSALPHELVKAARILCPLRDCVAFHHQPVIHRVYGIRCGCHTVSPCLSLYEAVLPSRCGERAAGLLWYRRERARTVPDEEGCDSVGGFFPSGLGRQGRGP